MKLALRNLQVTLLCLASAFGASAAENLEQDFRNPPDSAKPHTWWHWMNGMITREGISKDLAEMKRVGLGGAQIFNVNDGIPAGPVKFMSDEWRSMVKHAVEEADRQGLELCLHNCAGWSSSGGPWIKPEQAMQFLTWSERRIAGPRRFAETLEQPPTRLSFYRDIAVIAFPTPAGEDVRMTDFSPKITASNPGFDAPRIVDGRRETTASLPLPEPGKSQYLQFEFAKPFQACSLTVMPGPGRNSHQGELQISQDGFTFQTLQSFAIPQPDSGQSTLSLNLSPVTSRFYRLLFTRPAPRANRMTFAEVELNPGFRLNDWSGKACFFRMDNPQADLRTAPAGAVIQRERVLDLTSSLDANGRLTWDVPEGQWTILRLGYTPTGKDNHPAPEEGRGLECDKLSQEAAEAHWSAHVQKILDDIGPLAGKTLKHVLIDSYEVGSQNWTPKFREEFKRLRGYDLLPFLPCLTGRVVEKVETTERFLWDFRRTIADLFTGNYFGHFQQMAHQHGLQLSIEPYGNGPFDDLDAGGRADIPMTEFWAGWGNDMSGGKLAGSMAHTQGRKYVGAESFTAAPDQGAWRNHPYSMKALGDLMYCSGINRFIFHRYAHQPWLDRKPGMTMGQWGFHFEWTNTWWEQAPAWTAYLSRCQFLLQQGLFVGDLCYLNGENSPISLPGRGGLYPTPPPGYEYDGCNADVILTRMSVKDGRLMLPDGMSYRLLVLPPGETMTPELLRKIRELVQAGATVIGPRPQKSPSLREYPACDTDVKRIAEEVWGDCDGKNVTEHACGKGRAIWGKPLEEVLAAMSLKPDFAFRGSSPEASIASIHRRAGDAEIYFVSNQRDRLEAVDCTFRVSGKIPELWHPDTGTTERAPIYREEAGRTVVTLPFEPAGSVFVVFREKAKAGDHVVSVQRDGRPLSEARPRTVGEKLEIVKATYGVLRVEQLGIVEVTDQLKALVKDGTLTVQATNSIAGDPAPNLVKQLRVEYSFDGKPFIKIVEENQTLTLPDLQPKADGGKLEIRRAVYGDIPSDFDQLGKDLTVEVTRQLAELVKDGALTVVASNSIAGDPASMIVKQMRVDYTLDGVPHSVTVSENQTLTIPERQPSVSTAADLAITKKGEVELRAWESGTYQVRTASGKIRKLKISGVPRPLAVNGPWVVRFPPNWGAPEKVNLDELTSWTAEADPGVKYFSGTATYEKDFDVPAKLLAKDRTLSLDLGEVKVIAEVKVNGRDFGVLWKPPFRVDVTRTLKPGRNRMEIRVTNLWSNRLIGDEQLPDDREWNGPALKAWPQWVLEGKPWVRNQRYTWTTWRHYSKDSPLLESGLLGPVAIEVAVRRSIALR